MIIIHSWQSLQLIRFYVHRTRGERMNEKMTVCGQIGSHLHQQSQETCQKKSNCGKNGLGLFRSLSFEEVQNQKYFQVTIV